MKTKTGGWLYSRPLTLNRISPENQPRVFTSRVRRETFLDAFDLWMTPFDAEASMTGIAAFSAATAASLLLALTASRTLLMYVFRVDET